MDETHPNCQEETGGERLDRIERALELMLNDHILFREDHKQLLTAQVLLNGQLGRLDHTVEKLSGDVQRVSGDVLRLSADVQRVSADVQRVTLGLETLSGDVRILSLNVEKMRENFDARLKRLEA